jgi:hypothetical protein
MQNVDALLDAVAAKHDRLHILVATVARREVVRRVALASAAV